MVFNHPVKIEDKSFDIINAELEQQNIKVDSRYAHIIKRVIHSTADFEYAESISIHEKFIDTIEECLRSGLNIYADTNMILSGINKKLLNKSESKIYTLIDDEQIAAEAQKRKITRSIVGIEKACKNKGTSIFIIGNSPTALFKLKEIIDLGNSNIKCIIGVPVGFVGARESKEEILKTDIPTLITKGRKGGSTVAVAIMNAILKNYET